MYPK